MNVAIALAVGYLLGSFPSGYLAGRLRGVDIRTVGSGSMGATNVSRALGWPTAVAVLLIDAAKGLGAVLVGGALAGSTWGIAAGALAMAGHAWPVWLRFRGGKGVATGMGLVLGVAPLAIVAALPTWLAIVASTRLVSVASMTCAVLVPALTFALGADRPAVVFTIIAGIAIIALHRANIGRLARGEELETSLGRSGAE